MQPGELRALDREMAAIMGWTVEEWSTSGVPYEPLYRTGPTSHLAVVAWRPTERVDQAWMVVEALRAKGYLITLDLFPTFTWVTVGREDRVTGEAYGEAVLAICLAAKATEGEE